MVKYVSDRLTSYLEAPDLIATDLYASSVNGSIWASGDTITFIYNIANIGTADSYSSASALYISINPLIDPTDRILITDNDTGVLRVGEVSAEGQPNTFTFDLAALNLLPDRFYYVGAVADVNGTITELDETNNVSNVVQIYVEAGPLPDLTVLQFFTESEYVNSYWTDGEQIGFELTMANIGDANAGNSVLRLYISTDATITTDDTLLYSENVPGPVLPDEMPLLGDLFYAFTLDFAALGLTPGTYYVGAIVDATNLVNESNESNNVSEVFQVTLQAAPAPDLVATDLALSSTTWADGDRIDFTYNIENTGDADAGSSASALYISTDATITTGDILLNIDSYTEPVLSPGQVDPEGWPNNIILDFAALGLAPGTYYMGAIADVHDSVAESNETNNVSNVIQVSVEGNGDAARHDFNGDAISDILWRNDTTGQIGMYAMNDQGVAAWQGIGFASTVWDIVATGDFNGDGTDDILFRHTANGRIGMYAMDNGTATWQGIASPAQVWEFSGVGDFNGDGTDDILWRHATDGRIGMYAMDNGTAAWQGIASASSAWQIAGTGDFNGDGTDDILFRHATSGNIGMYAMNNGAATWQGIASPAQVWATVGTGDFNGDGTDDILWRHTTTGEVGMYVMNNGAATWQSIATPSHVWDIVGTGDFNGDGTDDILFRQTNNNSVGVYVMDNGNPTWLAIGNPALAWSVEGQDVDSFHFL